MPGPDYSKTVQGLLESGHAPTTPCAVVSNAGRKNEEVRYLTIQELASANGIPAPAVLIVGEVAAQHSSHRHEEAGQIFSGIPADDTDTHLPLGI
jgi:siroheme synthase